MPGPFLLSASGGQKPFREKVSGLAKTLGSENIVS